MKNLFIFSNTLIGFIFSLATFHSFAQDSIRISGQLQNNSRFAKVVVQKFGVGAYDIAAVSVDKETGAFSIAAPADVAPGIYRFRYSQTGYNDYVDVIINGAELNIAFSIDVEKAPEGRTPVFSKSDENIAWVTFLGKLKSINNELLMKQDFLVNYPNKESNIYQQMLTDYEESKNVYLQHVESFVASTPFFWARNCALYLNSFFPNLNDHPRLQQFYAHQAFWNSKPTSDTNLINSPLYTDAILSYLQYFMDPEMGFGEEERNKGFEKCIDTVMSRFSGSDIMKEFAFKYLSLGFKEIGEEAALQYLDENYQSIAAQCFDNTEQSEFEKRMEGYTALKVGNRAPNFKLHGNTNDQAQTKNSSEQARQLHGLTSEAIVLVFWASWCPHCMEVMPEINAWAAKQKGLKVVAVSMDTDSSAYAKAIHPLQNMIHSCDFKGWASEAASAYYIAATPTFILLDNEMLIEGKFSSFEQVKAHKE